MAMYEARTARHESVYRPRGRINIFEVAESAADNLLLLLAIDRLEHSSRQYVSIVGVRGNDGRRADDLESDSRVDKTLALVEWR